MAQMGSDELASFIIQNVKGLKDEAEEKAAWCRGVRCYPQGQGTKNFATARPVLFQCY